MPTTPRFAIPYPAATDAPDGPGALLTIAKWLDDRVAPADAMVHAAFTNGGSDSPVPNATWGEIPNDAALYDPRGMRQSDGLNFKIPFAGRWSFYHRIAFTSDDLANRYILCWYNSTVGADMAWKAIGPVRTGVPLDMYTEEVLPANTTVRPRIFKDGTVGQWVQRQLSGIQRTQSIIRYLGPS